MGSLTIIVSVLGLFLTGSLPTPPTQPQSTVQAVTPAPNGPFRVERNRILDTKGRPFLLRGTQLPQFRLQTAERDSASGQVFGPYSATSLSAIRLRFNMNAVRLPVNVLESSSPGFFPELAKVVRRANDMDLLVIVAALEPGSDLPSRQAVDFWTRCAAYFKDSPNVFFDAFSEPAAGSEADAHSPLGWQLWQRSMQPLVKAIRSAGATQPILAMSWNDGRSFEGAGPTPPIADSNIVYEVSPRYASTRTDAQRDAQFGFLAASAPVSANDWDLKLDDAAACSVLPSDPTAASQLVEANLGYFDAHQISWTVSTFEPGKLIKDFSFHDATTLENGWTCGQPVYPYAGLGRVVEGHLRASQERGLFVVSASGGLVLARGGFALAYGPVMAERDSISTVPQAPSTLGGVSVEVTDSAGVTRPAGMLWASAGWGQVNFVIPKESALGPARMTVVRTGGSRTSANITIAETAPGFVTGHSCRGAAIGYAIQVFKNGRSSSSLLSKCEGIECRTLAVPVTRGATTKVRLDSSGLRNARSTANIEVTIGGLRVPVKSVAKGDDRGTDYLTIEIPAALAGLGETDLLCRVDGKVSNVVRIRIGGKPAV
jgi:uncharacterized protein (TIGR03437 family)